MFALLNRLRREDNGIAVTELALVTPIFLLLFLSCIELGHMIYYNITIEKALRSAATFAGRNEEWSDSVKTATKNIVKTGEPTGTDPYLVAGWADSDAQVYFDTKTYTDSSGADTLNATVITVTAEVPYVPVVGVLVPALEYLLHRQFQKGKLFVTRMHQQTIIGN